VLLHLLQGVVKRETSLEEDPRPYCSMNEFLEKARSQPTEIKISDSIQSTGTTKSQPDSTSQPGQLPAVTDTMASDNSDTTTQPTGQGNSISQRDPDGSTEASKATGISTRKGGWQGAVRHLDYAQQTLIKLRVRVDLFELAFRHGSSYGRSPAKMR
jgi:hypothetical protein